VFVGALTRRPSKGGTTCCHHRRWGFQDRGSGRWEVRGIGPSNYGFYSLMLANGEALWRHAVRSPDVRERCLTTNAADGQQPKHAQTSEQERRGLRGSGGERVVACHQTQEASAGMDVLEGIKRSCLEVEG
jgi:hypothetical protein